jgi:MYXO-CTERM domain-containing protein
MRLSHKLRISTVLIALAAGATASAQVTPAHGSGRRPRALDHERYRNGATWIDATRDPGHDRGALHALILSAGDRTFHAHIDRNAVVVLAPGADAASLWQREGLSLQRVLSAAAGIYLVAAEGGEDGLQLASRLAGMPEVAEAIPDLYLPRIQSSISIPPNDPRYGGQWYLKKLGIERAWQLSTGNHDTLVIVVDDGCDMQHPDLTANLSGGVDLVDKDDDPSFEPNTRGNAHGTECAGLIAAQADNDIGIAGVCPECSLQCLRLLPANGKAVPVSNDVMAFNYALEQGAAAVSNSWGFAEVQPVPAPIRTIIEKLYSDGRGGRGTLVVFAAGNENRMLGDDELEAIPGVLTVGAVNNFDEATSFSNFGPSVDLVAPTGTVTTDISGADGDTSGDYTELFGGTSSACPVAAGVAGLVMAANPELSASDVEQLLITSVRSARYATPDASGHDPIYGFGIIDPGAALRTTLGVSADQPMDAGEAHDAGAKPATTHRGSGGCSVRSAADGGSTWPLAVGVGVLALRRRRRRA